MNVTEEQATQKWCPFARSRAVEASSSQEQLSYAVLKGPDGTGINIRCIGSDCMAWQWDVPIMLNPPADSYIAEPGPTGHCGLTEGTHA